MAVVCLSVCLFLLFYTYENYTSYREHNKENHPVEDSRVEAEAEAFTQIQYYKRVCGCAFVLC